MASDSEDDDLEFEEPMDDLCRVSAFHRDSAPRLLPSDYLTDVMAAAGTAVNKLQPTIVVEIDRLLDLFPSACPNMRADGQPCGKNVQRSISVSCLMH